MNRSTPEQIAEAKRQRAREISDYIKELSQGDGQSQLRAKILQQVPKNYQYRYMKALKGELGRPAAVKLKCIECSGWSLIEVQHCTVKLCPLWAIRPGK